MFALSWFFYFLLVVVLALLPEGTIPADSLLEWYVSAFAMVWLGINILWTFGRLCKGGSNSDYNDSDSYDD